MTMRYESENDNYIRRRNHLLKQIKKQRWDDEEEDIKPKRKLKPKQIAKQDLNKGRNKFFKF